MNTAVRYFAKRNINLFFKDKGTFFASLITPIILFVLYISFLKNVYVQSIESVIPKGITNIDDLINSFASSQLISSILAVSCVTVAFCSNIIMAQDKITGARNDLLVTPIKPSQLALGYYLANVATTMIVGFIAAAVGFVYIAIIGWYFSFTDVVLILLDVVLTVLFGTAAAALVDSFISTQGGIGAVSTIISSLYGFLCGAYMPISQMGESFRDFVMFIPGTYATGLFRNHYMNSVLSEFSKKLPDEAITAIRDSFDMNMYFFDEKVSIPTMYLIVIISIVILLATYILVTKLRKEK
ncbi:MAG: ABC transporter permease [Acutalibacteraceae bacterium]|nr:ABC transporter permease [Acutalibacteraceae bacterium]